MDENQNLKTDEIQDTIPDESYEEATDIVSDEETVVIPNDSDQSQDNIARDTESQAQDAVSETAEDTTPFVSVQYNHKTKNLTKDEAVQLIQKGMHTEHLRSKLEYLANYYGTDINSLVDQLITAPEQAYQTHLEQLYGKDSPDVKIGMQIYRQKQSDEYKKIMTERERNEKYIKNQKEINSVNSRLADEYLNLKNEIPNAPEYAKLPNEVIVEAANGKRDLLSAYLCYLNREKNKIDAAKKIQEAANNASSKSMKSKGRDNINSQERNFLSGLWDR